MHGCEEQLLTCLRNALACQVLFKYSRRSWTFELVKQQSPSSASVALRHLLRWRYKSGTDSVSGGRGQVSRSRDFNVAAVCVFDNQWLLSCFVVTHNIEYVGWTWYKGQRQLAVQHVEERVHAWAR
jgi:hypothetical protein